jgi:predicted dehydrogenase
MNGEKSVRVGVIGRGFGARVVAPMFEATDGCEVVDVVSPRDDGAVSELCNRTDVDLVSVHSPPFMHLEHVRRAVDGGHAVLCDKPFGCNATEAEEMCNLARDAGIVNLLNYEFRVHPVRSQLRALALDGAVGTVEHVQWTSFAGLWRSPLRNYGWVFDASRGGGWVRVFASHNLDFINWTFGRIVEASAQLRTTIAERPDADGTARACTAEDGFIATLLTDHGISATIDATATGGVDRPTRVTVVGSDGVLEMLSENVHEVGGRILLHTPERSAEVYQIDSWTDPSGHDDTAMGPWAKLIRDAVRDGEPDPLMPTFADGLACARVMDQLTGQR